MTDSSGKQSKNGKWEWFHKLYTKEESQKALKHYTSNELNKYADEELDSMPSPDPELMKLAHLFTEAAELMTSAAEWGGQEYDPHGLSYRLQVDRAIIAWVKTVHPDYLTEIIEAIEGVKGAK